MFQLKFSFCEDTCEYRNVNNIKMFFLSMQIISSISIKLPLIYLIITNLLLYKPPVLFATLHKYIPDCRLAVSIESN